MTLAACGADPTEDTPPRSVLGPARDAVTRLEGDFQSRTVVTSVYGLVPEQINVHTEPFKIDPFDAQETVWLRGWSVSMEDADGQPAPGDLQCHATLSDLPLWAEDRVFQGLCTDGFTPDFQLPDGFAIKVPAGARWIFQPMFSNRRRVEHEVRMRIDTRFVLESDRTADYTPLSCFAVSVEYPQMYWVAANSTDTRTRTFKAPQSGRVHAIGGHIHPYGKHLELIRESTGEVLYRPELSGEEELAKRRLPLYTSGDGFYMREGETLRINSFYVNPTDGIVDAMGGFFVFFDPKGKPDA